MGDPPRGSEARNVCFQKVQEEGILTPNGEGWERGIGEGDGAGSPKPEEGGNRGKLRGCRGGKGAHPPEERQGGGRRTYVALKVSNPSLCFPRPPLGYRNTPEPRGGGFGEAERG